MNGRAVLEGSLSFINLAELFQILGGNNSTGVLRVISQYAPNPGVIYFVKGNPINATNGSLRGLEAVYSLFGWTEGKFEFAQENVQVDRVIKNSRMEIVLDALRMLDDRAIKKLGPASLEGIPQGKRGLAPGKKSNLPVIKGSMVDYLYIVQEEEYIDGRVVVREASHGKWIWVILEGTATVTKETPQGPLSVARLGEGSYIGAFSSLLFHDIARTATVTAEGDVRLGLLDTQRLAGEFRTLSNDFRNALLSLDRRRRMVTDRAVEWFLKKPLMALPKGCEVLIPAGSSSAGVYAVEEGEAYVIGQSENTPLPLVVLKKDDIFGNIPLIDVGHEPRNAMIVAPKGTKANKLDPREFENTYNQLSGTFRSMIYCVSTSIALTTRLAYLFRKGK
jgi:CRP-like cAMP-binding protein